MYKLLVYANHNHSESMQLESGHGRLLYLYHSNCKIWKNKHKSADRPNVPFWALNNLLLMLKYVPNAIMK